MGILVVVLGKRGLDLVCHFFCIRWSLSSDFKACQLLQGPFPWTLGTIHHRVGLHNHTLHNDASEKMNLRACSGTLTESLRMSLVQQTSQRSLGTVTYKEKVTV